MSLPSRTRILPDQVPLSTESSDAFSRAFREAAQAQELSVRQTCRYEAWALAFLAWCREDSSRSLSADQVAAFRTALRDGSTIGEEAICEAMDALSFLFGSAHTARAHLAQDGTSDSSTDSEEHDPFLEKDVLSLQAQWQEDEDRSVDSAPVGAASETENDDGDASTAELCIEQFQSRLDTIHSTEVESA